MPRKRARKGVKMGIGYWPLRTKLEAKEMADVLKKQHPFSEFKVRRSGNIFNIWRYK